MAVICAGLYPTVVVPLQIAYFGKPRPVSTFCVQANGLDVLVLYPPPSASINVLGQLHLMDAFWLHACS